MKGGKSMGRAHAGRGNMRGAGRGRMSGRMGRGKNLIKTPASNASKMKRGY